ncbi:MAG: hypothetical protein IJM12_06730 [Bacteroidales bacterium]|nr:hypothetical protein [Bacteroidales bacterium]
MLGGRIQCVPTNCRVPNFGGGKDYDIVALVRRIQDSVEEKLGIRIHPEIYFVKMDASGGVISYFFYNQYKKPNSHSGMRFPWPISVSSIAK